MGRGCGRCEIAEEVGARDAATLAPLATRAMPAEVAPLSEALNQLLARLAQAIDTQRAFVADAAHALRTPLAALQLQAQLVERADGAEARRAAARLRQGLERLTHLVNQLLTLARQSPARRRRRMKRWTCARWPARWWPT